MITYKWYPRAFFLQLIEDAKPRITPCHLVQNSQKATTSCWNFHKRPCFQLFRHLDSSKAKHGDVYVISTLPHRSYPINRKESISRLTGNRYRDHLVCHLSFQLKVLSPLVPDCQHERGGFSYSTFISRSRTCVFLIMLIHRAVNQLNN